MWKSDDRDRELRSAVFVGDWRHLVAVLSQELWGDRLQLAGDGLLLEHGPVRLGKRPVSWCYRPLGWPAWNAHDRRAARFWSATRGLDDPVISALTERHLDQASIVEPSNAEFSAQLLDELTRSHGHLRRVLEHFWDDGWRRDHRGFGMNPEDHLWRAARAFVEIEDALAQLRP